MRSYGPRTGSREFGPKLPFLSINECSPVGFIKSKYLCIQPDQLTYHVSSLWHHNLKIIVNYLTAGELLKEIKIMFGLTYSSTQT